MDIRQAIEAYGGPRQLFSMFLKIAGLCLLGQALGAWIGSLAGEQRLGWIIGLAMGTTYGVVWSGLLGLVPGKQQP